MLNYAYQFMGLTFKQLADKFLEGETAGKTGGSGNLKIKGDQLIHYSTVIAERHNNKIFLNVSRYSIQTGIIQKYLRNIISFKKLVEVHMVPKNYLGKLVSLVKE